ncbi:proton-coupled amino acid transporter-like protein pathetic isoform X1 [Pieris napi]|uniref:proton-coupled amino acid transporter-like protein pathetic isoform X1 n=1 Tax=Pieris napi TaxID=78633 RepID=UPI001FB92C79|nr:proton-coupled amino acid transporter-like protein pathetic isoform X1 [Pieris napi]
MELSEKQSKNYVDHGDPPESKYTHSNNEQKEYDFVANRPVRKRNNLFEAVGHFVKSCLGGGILGIHEAFMKCGLWTALFVSIIFGIYISYCLHMLVSAAQKLCKQLHVPEMSYPDVAEASLEVCPFPSLRRYSKWFRYAVDLTIIIDLFGASCVYQIMIAKTIMEVVENREGSNELDLGRLRLYILALLIPILILCMIRSLKYLAPFSIIGDIFIVICVIATVVYGLRSAPPISTVPGWKDAVGFFEFCGIVVFSLEAIAVMLPIENNMKNPKQYPAVIACGMFTVLLFLLTIGFFGYWGFGENCVTPVTLNFPNDIFPTVIKSLIGVMIFLTFALNFWVPFNLVWHYISKRHDPKKHWIWERVYRAIFIVLITIISIIFPNIGNFMGLLGAFALSNMGFIFPAIIDLVIVWERPGLGKWRWRLWRNIAIIFVGILLFFAGTYSNVKGLLKTIL